MDPLTILFSFLFLLALFAAYRQSCGLLSVPFLIMLYITFLYLGALYFYFTQGHHTFVFVFFMAVFYLTGMCIANMSSNPDDRKFVNRPLRIYTPVSSSVLKFTLIALFFVAISVAIYRVSQFGVPLFERAWYTAGIRSTTGVFNKLLFNTGVVSLIILGLVSYGLYKSQNNNSFKYLSILFFLAYFTFETLQGGKSTAIMPFLLIGMAMFYRDRKFPKKFMTISVILALFLALFIGSFWIGSFSPQETLRLFYDRATSIAALHLDYLLSSWANDHSYQFGQTFILEIKRLFAQVTLTAKEPLFNEIIGNLRGGYSIERVTGVSPEISIFGMGYANFGITGAILTALVLGFIVQRIHLHLILRKSLNLFSFTIWIYFVFKLLGLVRAGNVLISLEKFLIEIIPALVMILIGYLFFALPFPSTLKWQRLRLKGDIA